MHLQGRTVLLTGAGGGIGHHIAETLARRGARVVASDIDEDRLEPLAGVAARLGADLRDLDAAEALVARAEEAAGPLDVLVNCAGLEYTGAYADQERAEIEDLVRVNLLAPMTLIRAALPGMLARGRGHVVNIASVAGKGPAPYLATYGTTKAALIELTRSLRVEHRGTGVGFSAVSPGFVEREGMYARMAEDDLEAPVALGTSPPEQVAVAVAEAVEDDIPEKLVTARPMRPFFALTELVPRAGELGIIVSGARRFLGRVAGRRGRA
jgi:NAD(P)-dependent dehydrogenase (short-subunit alcohol dehydrogenase family)